MNTNVLSLKLTNADDRAMLSRILLSIFTHDSQEDVDCTTDLQFLSPPTRELLVAQGFVLQTGVVEVEVDEEHEEAFSYSTFVFTKKGVDLAMVVAEAAAAVLEF